jgi:hypothetical protein
MKLYSVTEVLQPFSNYAAVPAATLKAAADRGRRIHAAAAAKLSDVFQVVPLEPGDEGYLSSLLSWIEEMVRDVIDVEPELIDEKLGFKGHPDLICRLVSGAGAVVDYKTPAVESPTWKSQIAAYRHLSSKSYRHLGHMLRPLAVALMLRSDGGMPKAVIYPSSDRDFQAFLSALTAFRYFHPCKEADHD